MSEEFPDWRRAPNIAQHPELYELENEAIARDGRLDAALMRLADWTGRTLLDVGAGTGFWLPRYAEHAARVMGIEPDPELRKRAAKRVGANLTVLAGSAESIPLPDACVDVAHARFAYFFGEGCDAGLAEVRRVLRPEGVFVVVDNSWRDGAFAELLRLATTGNAAIDPDATDAWWAKQGAQRTDVDGAWHCKSLDELEAVLRIEFPGEVVDGFLADHHDGSPVLTYQFAVWRLR